tara:strand:+ start:347 stop:589 length:243 start_codon:yes stop_codon:yes gene_type:complete
MLTHYLNMMEDAALSLYQAIVLAGGLVGVYVKLTTEVGKLKSRIMVLEKQDNTISETLKQLSKDIAEIKLLLARKQLDVD